MEYDEWWLKLFEVVQKAYDSVSKEAGLTYVILIQFRIPNKCIILIIMTMRWMVTQ